MYYSKYRQIQVLYILYRKVFHCLDQAIFWHQWQDNSTYLHHWTRTKNSITNVYGMGRMDLFMFYLYSRHQKCRHQLVRHLLSTTYCRLSIGRSVVLSYLRSICNSRQSVLKTSPAQGGKLLKQKMNSRMLSRWVNTSSSDFGICVGAWIKSQSQWWVYRTRRVFNLHLRNRDFGLLKHFILYSNPSPGLMLSPKLRTVAHTDVMSEIGKEKRVCPVSDLRFVAIQRSFLQGLLHDTNRYSAGPRSRHHGVLFQKAWMERFSLQDPPGWYARLTAEYIRLADILENHNTPLHSSLDSDWRDATSSPLCSAYSKIRRAIPRFLADWCSKGALLSPMRLTMSSTAICNPNNSGQLALMSSDPIGSPWTGCCLESKRSCRIRHASKPFRTDTLLKLYDRHFWSTQIVSGHETRRVIISGYLFCLTPLPHNWFKPAQLSKPIFKPLRGLPGRDSNGNFSIIGLPGTSHVLELYIQTTKKWEYRLNATPSLTKAFVQV